MFDFFLVKKQFLYVCVREIILFLNADFLKRLIPKRTEYRI